jgi:Uma2 family endonuclease
MTRAEFLAWVATREDRWEFDGFAPVAMTGGTRNHSRVGRNVVAALVGRLRGGPCEVLGSDAGVAVPDGGVRYPDALVTCTPGRGGDRLIADPVIVFEVVSPTSGRTDRILKLREYRAVPSIRRYVILESTNAALTVLERLAPEDPWIATSLTGTEILPLPEIGTEVPVAELYEGVEIEEFDEPAAPLNPVATT